MLKYFILLLNPISVLLRWNTCSC